MREANESRSRKLGESGRPGLFKEVQRMVGGRHDKGEVFNASLCKGLMRIW